MAKPLPGPDLRWLKIDDIVNRAKKKRRWSARQATEAREYYEAFLRLSHGRKTPLRAIHKNADVIWHEHILETKRYRADCERIFGPGYYLDHNPSTRAMQTPTAIKRAQGVYAPYGLVSPNVGVPCY